MDDVTRTNTEKVLYPATGFTKGEVLDYRERVAPALLPHVRGRPASFKRFPDGVDAEGFFQKNAPRGTPDWCTPSSCRRRGPRKGGRRCGMCWSRTPGR
jgi:bifunctional non-homologous end joining protein LigD